MGTPFRNVWMSRATGQKSRCRMPALLEPKPGQQEIRWSGRAGRQNEISGADVMIREKTAHGGFTTRLHVEA
jgi:hypothetical protein